ncbi:tetratricopeptide repeat protein [Ornithinimicrobium cerasi]|nr:hypothetical protein [Ornithinimicrobium cerasi]
MSTDSTGLAYPFDLGTYSRAVTTRSEEAGVWFTRGLVWTLAFNHEEADLCFRTALEHDPTCAMAHWGVALALGPNYNKPWEFFTPDEARQVLERARSSAAAALAGSEGCTAVERALIAALQVRYPADRPVEECQTWEHAFAQAMGAVHDEHRDDPDVACLYAGALMNLTAWQLWDGRTGRPAEGSRTLEARSVLEQALARPGGDRHPGLLHMYIHLMEMSPTPEVALPVAERLRGLVPDAGHLEHMPSHLHVLVGDYEQALVVNQAASRADAAFVAARGPLNFSTLYRAHNLHFQVYASMFLGRSGDALRAAEALEAEIPRALLLVDLPPMADWLEAFVPVKVHALVRFGRWQDLVSLPLPQDPDLYCTTTAMLHYGKGVASAALGQVDAAERERELFRGSVARVPASRMLFNNTSLDLLQVADAMLDGEVDYRRGRVEEAFEHLRRAIELDDALPYDEPWGWLQPTRHAYGALLLEQGRVEEAERVYRADLGLDDTLPRSLQHPGNVWALHGYHECLVRLGRRELASEIEPRLRAATDRADVPVLASCLCRLDAAPTCCTEGPPDRPA